MNTVMEICKQKGQHAIDAFEKVNEGLDLLNKIGFEIEIKIDYKPKESISNHPILNNVF